MIVDAATLAAKPIADEVLRLGAGAAALGVGDVEISETGIGWSNELALHLIELKTAGPVGSLRGLGAKFDDSVRRINTMLAPMGACLMPSAMHPFMDPLKEMRLWPHDNAEIYGLFDKVFGCTGHGWANLQSAHLNLPFRDDAEFGRLHAAIRLLLPILPALSASSPIMDGKMTGKADNRLAVYRTNARRVPSVSGRVIPEPVFTKGEYEGVLLEGIYRDLSPHDPEGVLRHEWVNSRGAIARFTRNTIEIRVLDVQECPQADVAICAAITAATRALVEERITPLAAQQAWDVDALERVLLDVIDLGDLAVIRDRAYLDALGVPALLGPAVPVTEVWAHLIETWLVPELGSDEFLPALGVILREGTLSRRIRRRVRQNMGIWDGDFPMWAVYEDLCESLPPGKGKDNGFMFRAAE
ncbi:MAG: glutamate--cysteine ligase [Phycisphaerales bacterium]|nr:glutamate--cysteine ligase [Phycisphaerales bacterium]